MAQKNNQAIQSNNYPTKSQIDLLAHYIKIWGNLSMENLSWGRKCLLAQKFCRPEVFSNHFFLPVYL